MRRFRRPVRPGRYAPSALTTTNLFLGFLAIVLSFNEQFIPAAWFIIIGGFMDLLDGKIARLIDSQSRFGGELDSLADLVTFGVAPIMLVYQPVLQDYGIFGLLGGFSFIMCGAFRLARFNLQTPTKEKGNFKGLPIPAAAGLVSSFILFSDKVLGESAFQFSIFIIGLIILASILMISNIEYVSFPKFSFKTRRARITTISFMIYFAFLAVFPAYIFFPTGVVYVLSGIIRALVTHFSAKMQEMPPASA